MGWVTKRGDELTRENTSGRWVRYVDPFLEEHQVHEFIAGEVTPEISGITAKRVVDVETESGIWRIDGGYEVEVFEWE